MKIVVLMGGDTPEREVSLRSGAGVGRALIELGHEVTLLDTGTGRVLPDPDAALALGTPGAGSGSSARGALVGPGAGAPPAGVSPVALERAPGAGTGNLDVYVRAIPRKIDLAFITLHGGDGENGVLQAVLDSADIPYTGSGVLASSVSMDKSLSKRIFRDLGIPTPSWMELQAPADPSEPWSPPIAETDIQSLGGYPVIVKPNDQGSSVGISVAHSFEELRAGLESARRYGRILLVEAFIEGREVTVSVLDQRAFPVVEIIPEGGFYDYEHKYTAGASRYEVPANLPHEATERLLALAIESCRALRCTGIARVDFRLAEDGTPYCLEVNTVPGMTETSLVPKTAAAAGLNYKELVRAIVESASTARTARSPA